MLDWVLGFIGGLAYPLFSIIFLCVDGLQGLFFALAGIGDIRFGASNNVGGDKWGTGQQITSGSTGGETDTGLIYYLFRNSLVKNLLISIMLLALFLIIVFTVMAFIKNAYAAKQKSWKEIIGNSIKGLANFILLPVLCLLGVWLANILLQAINGATSGGGATQMSRKLFIAAAYNANEFRNEDPDISDKNIEKLKDWADGLVYLDTGEKFNVNSIQLGQSADYYAKIVDDIYAQTNVSIHWWGAVEKWYALWEVNYLVLIVGGIFMLSALATLAFGMVKRMFLLVILFVVSPAICALYPLDEGKAVQSWSAEVKKNILSAHGAVAAINIFFAIMPLIDNLHFSNVFGSVAFIDDLLQLFILVVGLMCVNEFTGLLSGFVGGADAYGSSKGQIKAATSSIAKTVIGGAGVFAVAKAATAGKSGRDAVGAFFGSMGKQALEGVQKGTGFDFGGLKKTYKDEYQKAEEKYTAKSAEKEFHSEYDVERNETDEEYNHRIEEEAASGQKVNKKRKKVVDKDRKKEFVDENGIANIAKLREMLDDASLMGVDEKEVYKTFMKNIGKDGDLGELRKIKRDLGLYDKQQVKDKEARASAYSAHGVEFERSLDGAILNIRTQETNIQSAESTFNAASVAHDQSVNKLKSFIDGYNGKGQGKTTLNKIMRNKVEREDFTPITEDEMRGMSNSVQTAAKKFNSMLAEASKKLETFNTAERNLTSARETQANNIKSLNDTIISIEQEFSTVRAVVDKLGGTADKTADKLEELVQSIKKDIRS